MTKAIINANIVLEDGTEDFNSPEDLNRRQNK